MNDFKIGDRVTVLNTDSAYLKKHIGQEGEVIKVVPIDLENPFPFLVRLQGKRGERYERFFGPDELKLVEGEQFPVGTKVRVIDTKSSFHGVEGVVALIDEEDDDLSHLAHFGEHKIRLWLRREDLEALEDDGPKNLAVTREQAKALLAITGNVYPANDASRSTVDLFFTLRKLFDIDTDALHDELPLNLVPGEHAKGLWVGEASDYFKEMHGDLVELADDPTNALVDELEYTKKRLATETEKVAHLNQQANELIDLHVDHERTLKDMLDDINELRDEHAARAEKIQREENL